MTTIELDPSIAVKLVEAGGQVNVADAAGKVYGEIGRASCRERV